MPRQMEGRAVVRNFKNKIVTSNMIAGVETIKVSVHVLLFFVFVNAQRFLHFFGAALFLFFAKEIRKIFTFHKRMHFDTQFGVKSIMLAIEHAIKL